MRRRIRGVIRDVHRRDGVLLYVVSYEKSSSMCMARQALL